MAASDKEWTDEALRLYRRYEREAVDAYSICPWASRVRRDGRLAECILLQVGDEDVGASVDVIAGLPDHIDLALLIYPRIAVPREAFERFAARVRDTDGARCAPEKTPFVSVVFHPDAAPNLDDPERLIPFLRRTPDPTMQFVRATVLDKVRGALVEGTQFVDPATLTTTAWEPQQPTLRERIARANLDTTLRVGVETIARLLDDIGEDRNRTYRRLEAL